MHDCGSAKYQPKRTMAGFVSEYLHAQQASDRATENT